MEPLKNLYNTPFFEELYTHLSKIVEVDQDNFLSEVYNKEWDNYELKQRMKHISGVLNLFLNKDFSKAAKEIELLVTSLQKDNVKKALEYMFLPDYIEQNGLKLPEISLRIFENITEFTSCEFAIRPFIIQHETYVLSKLKEWSFHSNHHVRRLASEGCRPRLPWAMALPEFKKSPKAIIPILENLINDNSEYVRKSVANNLNDISKDHPDFLIAFTKKYIGETEQTDWILKHANRTLLKAGNQELMPLFGYGNTNNIDIQHFKVHNPSLNLGEYLTFHFDLINNNNTTSKVRLEYAIYYLKKNGTLSKKVFKISEKQYAPFSRNQIERKQHFKPISTRVYHFGIHKVSIIANGKEFDVLEFELAE